MLKLNLIALIAGVVLFSACSKKETAPAVSVADSKSMVASADIDVQTSHDEFVSTDALKANAVLSDFDFVGNYAPGDPANVNARKSREKSVMASRMYDAAKKHIPAAFNRILLDVLDSDFSNAVGVYEYNATTESFDQTTKGGTSVVVKFPYPKSNATNNAVYTVSKYVETEVKGNLQPTAIEANLQIGGVPVMTISVAATYDANGDPTAASVDYTFGNRSVKVNLTSSSTEISASVYYAKNGSNVYGATTGIIFTNINKSDFGQVTFSYLLGKIIYKGTYDVSGLFSDPNTTSANTVEKVNALYDKYVKLELDRSSDGLKFADVKVRANNSGSANYVIFYSDGSQGDLTPILSALLRTGLSSDDPAQTL